MKTAVDIGLSLFTCKLVKLYIIKIGALILTLIFFFYLDDVLDGEPAVSFTTASNTDWKEGRQLLSQ